MNLWTSIRTGLAQATVARASVGRLKRHCCLRVECSLVLKLTEHRQPGTTFDPESMQIETKDRVPGTLEEGKTAVVKWCLSPRLLWWEQTKSADSKGGLYEQVAFQYSRLQPWDPNDDSQTDPSFQVKAIVNLENESSVGLIF